MADLSEFGSIEMKAFDGADCKQGWPARCAVLHIMAKQGQVSNEKVAEATLALKFDDLVERESVLSKESANVTADWQIACKFCGLARPLDVLETNNSKYDSETGLSSPMNMTLSKSGSQRRKEEARAQMEAVAEAFRFELNTIVEATRLFNLFHEHGAHSGGRGHKVTAVAALRVASLNAGFPVQVSKLCKAHPEKPSVKVVNRFLSDARKNNLYDPSRLDAPALLSKLVGAIETPPDVLKEATRLSNLSIPNMRADAQAAASLFVASGDAKTRPRRFSGVAIAQVAMIDRKSIYRAAEVIRAHERPLVLTNPQESGNRPIPSTIIKELRAIRRR